MIALIAILLSQTAPPCPAWLTPAECIICQDLYLNMGIDYEDCPCNPASDSYGDGSTGGGGSSSSSNQTFGSIGGSCCTGSACVMVVCEDECLVYGGTFIPNTICEESGCLPNVGSCCLEDVCSTDVPITSFVCTRTLINQCYIAGGSWTPTLECWEIPNCASAPCMQVSLGVCCYFDGETMNTWCVSGCADEGDCPFDSPICEALGGTYFDLEVDESCADAIQFRLDPCTLPLDTCEIQEWACCLETVCQEMEQDDCTALNGFWAYGYSCAETECYFEGACCVEDICQVRLEDTCGFLGGTYYGHESECAAIDCEVSADVTGACCVGLTCSELGDSEACATAGGGYYGDWTACSEIDCNDDPPNPDPDGGYGSGYGACCVGSTCVTTTAEVCAASQYNTFHGVGTECTPDFCDDDEPPVGIEGACCVEFICYPQNFLTCVNMGGVFLGNGVSCNNNPCDDTGSGEWGACCDSDAVCTMTLQITCFELGNTFVGGTCLPAGVCTPSSKMCECILLQGILDNNRLILEALVQMGYTLEESLYVQKLIEVHTRESKQLLTMQLAFLDMLALHQVPAIVEMLQEITDIPDGALGEYVAFDGTAIYNDIFYEMNDDTFEIEIFFKGSLESSEEDDWMGGLADTDIFDEPTEAPKFSVDFEQLFPSYTGAPSYANFTGTDYEFDFQLLEDWGIKPIIKVIFLFFAGWFIIGQINLETRK